MINLTVNGITYAYPQTGDQNWGTGASNWAIAVTSGMLSQAGGSFPLTADANFGTNFGLFSKYLTSITANPAGSGVIRLANADAIGFRNSGNTADLLLKPDADGILQYNSIDLVNLSATQTLTNKSISGSTNTLSNIPFSAFSTLTAGYILVGNVSNAATAVALSGDATLSNAGVISIGSSAITSSKIASGAVGNTQLASSSVALSNMANLAANSVIGNSTGSSATPTAISLVSTATASTAMIRDTNANVAINNINEAFTTQVTAAGTTTLTVASNPLQQFTGTSTQVCALPSASTLVTGCQYQIFNRSTGSVTVKDGGGNTLQVMAGASQCVFTCAANGSAAGTWDISYATTAAATTLVRSGVVNLSSSATTATISYSSALPSTSYSLTCTFQNSTDSNPMLQPICITTTSTTGATLIFNAPLLTSNYSINYQAISNV